MEKINGGPAFPDPGRAQSVKQRELIGGEGMNLRDYFAAKAMQAYITARAHVYGGSTFDEDLSRWSYETADAMLRAREST